MNYIKEVEKLNKKYSWGFKETYRLHTRKISYVKTFSHSTGKWVHI